MPRSALNSGCVDRSLPPDGIALELVRISQHPLVNGGRATLPHGDSIEHDDALTVLFSLLRDATRVDYGYYKRSTVMRRIQRRLILHRMDRLEDYLAYAQEHPAELHALHRDLLINVTRFFRDPDAFEALTTAAFPAMMENRSADVPIRIWVPGCATGEEVYSLAIRLLEFLGDRAGDTAIKIFATDISEPALAKARMGKYLENITADVSPERLERFFIRKTMTTRSARAFATSASLPGTT
jgi:two-component system CheB/CheR fusion protein